MAGGLQIIENKALLLYEGSKKKKKNRIVIVKVRICLHFIVHNISSINEICICFCHN